MSVDKWAYDPETCEGRACPGDCDLCDIPKNPEKYEAEALHGKATGEHAGDEYISVADAYETIARRTEAERFTAKEICEMIGDVPTTDLAHILEHSEIVGYTFKELCMFAEACRMKGIEEDDLKNFCTAAESAAEYTLDKIMESFEKNALDQVTQATVDDDAMNEQEDKA